MYLQVKKLRIFISYVNDFNCHFLSHLPSPKFDAFNIRVKFNLYIYSKSLRGELCIPANALPSSLRPYFPHLLILIITVQTTTISQILSLSLSTSSLFFYPWPQQCYLANKTFTVIANFCPAISSCHIDAIFFYIM